MKKFIAVAGNMGAGKTSMVQFLCARYGFHAIYEPYLANPYLDDFYQDMPRWAFHSQLYFLTHKFRLHLGLHENTGTVVLDRSIYEDAEIFATHLHRRGMIPDRDFRTYSELYETMKVAIQPPDLMIYLRCDLRAIRRRIKHRGRPSEQEIPVDYLRQLNRLYDDWIDRYDASPKLIWDSARHDYLTHLVDQLTFHRAIAAFI